MTKNPDSNTVMLGTNANGVAYNQVAQQQGRSYFYSPNYSNYIDEYGADAMSMTNRAFVFNAKKAGKTFWFSHNPISQIENLDYANSAFTKELKYIEKLYNITISSEHIVKSGDYWFLVP